MSREKMTEAFQRFGEVNLDAPAEAGTPEAEITARVDVAKYLDVKRAAMRAHASQIPEQSFFLSLDDEMFAFAFGTEWFIREGHAPETTLDL